jgi:hypothetical protein
VFAPFDRLDARLDKQGDRIDKLCESIADLRTQMIRGDLQTRIGMLVLMGAAFAVMARALKWL